MFHRRLLLLLAVMCCVTSVLAAQLAHLTVLDGPHLRRQAESVLSTRQLIETRRGRIYDRRGRVLAEDRPSFDIAVDYEVLTGQWAYDQARRRAYRENRDRWGEVGFERREALTDRHLPEYEQQIEQLWQMLVEFGGIGQSDLERRRRTIIERVQLIRSDVWERRARRRAADLNGPVELSEVAIPIEEEREAHTLLPAVPNEVAYEFEKLSDSLPGLHVIKSRTRAYPLRRTQVILDRSSLPSPLRREQPLLVEVESLGGHVLGSLREVWAEDVARRPFEQGEGNIDLGGYLPGDQVGQSGIEAAMEDRLRGIRGQKIARKDTGEVQRQPAVPGGDVHLALDMQLQARVRAIMDPKFGLMRVQPWHENEHLATGRSLFGAAVVMEAATGEVLSLVSTPVPPPRIDGEPYPDLATHADRPLINKAIAGVYPPGSTLKPIVYCIAAQTGAVGPHEVIDCTGHLLPERPDVLRCWIYREQYGLITHGPLDPVEAIARSCNIYFYVCGRETGPRLLIEALHAWGFGQSTDLVLDSQVSGMMPRLDGGNPPGRALSAANATMMGIGQGPIAVPPIQVAAAHAALSNGGVYHSPLLVRERASRQARRDLNLSEEVAHIARLGMHESATNPHYGTAYRLPIGDDSEPILNIEGVVTRAKTGTAQAPRQYNLVRTEDGRVVPGDQLLRSGHHSWYLCHAHPRGRPGQTYIVAVLVEYGGSGGRAAGPVANQVLHALQEEGYL